MSKECKRSVNSCKISPNSLLFATMKQKKDTSTNFLSIVLLFLVMVACSPVEQNEIEPERVKVALRSVGNELLLSHQDSTSLVLPVVEIAPEKFKLSFENPLAFDPALLTSVVSETFAKAGLPTNYLVEVVQCTDEETAYSYEMLRNEENSIVPCSGRIVPENCYSIHVEFTAIKSTSSNNSMLFFGLVLLVLVFLAFVFYSRYQAFRSAKNGAKGTSLGSFSFYPDQNKLVKEAQEIPLSKKECELLAILAANPNQIVKRDELTKKVWEDHGVIVGRSLDTYISKLRKKLQDDDSIKLTNVHGVGYKLEIRG